MSGRERVDALMRAYYEFSQSVEFDGLTSQRRRDTQDAFQGACDAIARDLDRDIRWRPIGECKLYRALISNGHFSVIASRSESGAWWPDNATFPMANPTHFCPLTTPEER